MNGADFKSLMEMVGPVIGTFGAGSGVAQDAFAQSFQRGRFLATQERRNAEEDAQQKAQKSAGFLMDIGNHAQNFDDPVALDQFLRTAGHAYETSGFGPASDVVGSYTVPASKIADKKIKAIKDALGSLSGYNLDELAQSGAHVQLADGSDLPVSAALQLTRSRPMDASGKPIPVPNKIDTTQTTEEERYLAKKAKAAGMAFSDIPPETELKWRKEFRESGKTDRTFDPASPAAQFSDLMDIWKQNHPGQEPPADVRAQLREKANRVNDKPRALGGMDALYAASDPQAIADAIIRGDREPETASLGRPNGAAVDSILAQQGYNKAQAVTDWKATQRHIATMNGPQQLRLNQAINALPDMLDNVSTLAAKWKGGRFALLNRANLALAKQGAYGQEAASIANQLDAQIADVTADLGNVYMGGTSPTDHALGLAAQNLKGEWDEKVLRDMVALAKKNVTIRRNSIANTGVAGASQANPYAPVVQPPAANRIYYDVNGNPVNRR